MNTIRLKKSNRPGRWGVGIFRKDHLGESRGESFQYIKNCKRQAGVVE